MSVFALFLKGVKGDFDLLLGLESRPLKKVHPRIIAFMYLLCLSVFFQAFLDVLMELFILLEWMPKMPFRIDFISLTILSTVLGVQSLKGILHGRVDLTRNSMFVSFLVECALIAGDLYLIFLHPAYLEGTYLFRLPFLSLTGLNIVLLTYVAWKMKIFLDARGHFVIF